MDVAPFAEVPQVSPAVDWPTQLVLVRHGESIGNLADAKAHQTGSPTVDLAERDADVPLSQRGHRQAAAVGQWLASAPEAPAAPEVVLSSPYRRARQTAEAIVAQADRAGRPLPRLRTDERLRERELGWWDGLTGEGVRARYPEEAARREWLGKFYYRPPGGESWCDVALRIHSLLTTLRAEHAGKRVLLITHQAVIMNVRLILEQLDETEILRLDWESPLANCSVTAYQRSHDGWTPLLAGDTTAVQDLPVIDEKAAEMRDPDAVEAVVPDAEQEEADRRTGQRQ